MRCDVLSRSVFFFSFFLRGSIQSITFPSSAQPLLWLYATIRCGASSVFFCLFFSALVCHVNLECNLVAHLVYHLPPLPWLVQAPCTLRRHNMKDTWTWLLVATFSRVNIPLLCLPKFFGVVVVTPLARLLKTCCLFLWMTARDCFIVQCLVQLLLLLLLLLLWRFFQSLFPPPSVREAGNTERGNMSHNRGDGLHHQPSPQV